MKLVNQARSVDIAGLLGSTALAGKSLGQAHFPLLLSNVLECPGSSTVILDFADVENISASWVAVVLVPLLRLRRASSIDQYVVLQRLDEFLKEEVAYVLDAESTPAAYLAETGLEILGPLDDVYITVFRLVEESGTATAKALMANSHEAIGHTAWVKRLTTLYELGLLRRERLGREHVYYSLVERING